MTVREDIEMLRLLNAFMKIADLQTRREILDLVEGNVSPPRHIGKRPKTSLTTEFRTLSQRRTQRQGRAMPNPIDVRVG
jgi:hypothetical protein